MSSISSRFLRLRVPSTSMGGISELLDLAYAPGGTPLFQRAQAEAGVALQGDGMLLHQGARALEIWTGQPAPLEIMRRALEENVYG